MRPLAVTPKRSMLLHSTISKALWKQRHLSGKKNFQYRGLVFPALDTSLLLNIATAALKSNQEDSAMRYYSRLAAAEVKGPDLMEVYQALVDYYHRRGDRVNKEKYLALGRRLYPGSEVWYEAELQPLKDDKPALFARYKQLTEKNPASFYLHYNYAVELFNYVYAADHKPADTAAYQPLIEPAIKRAVQLDPNSADANYLAVRYYTEKIYQDGKALQALKSNMPAGELLPDNHAAAMAGHWNSMRPYAERVFELYLNKKELKEHEKANLKSVADVLMEYYTMQKNEAKAKAYGDRIKNRGL